MIVFYWLVFVQILGDTLTQIKMPLAGHALWAACSVQTLKVAGFLEKVCEPSGCSQGVQAPVGAPLLVLHAQAPSRILFPNQKCWLYWWVPVSWTHSCRFLLLTVCYHWKTNDSENHFIKCVLPKPGFHFESIGKIWTIFFSISTESSNLLVKNCSLHQIHIFPSLPFPFSLHWAKPMLRKQSRNMFYHWKGNTLTRKVCKRKPNLSIQWRLPLWQ